MQIRSHTAAAEVLQNDGDFSLCLSALSAELISAVWRVPWLHHTPLNGSCKSCMNSIHSFLAWPTAAGCVSVGCTGRQTDPGGCHDWLARPGVSDHKPRI
uniref:Uncharacterized protein n=1 Tax=Coccidioides posadasii RMSCC 3488 TaxID=454284 RepID=A0A0J6IB97_COCPO|nr:hypothetical protein CPAG_05245 [Coccidioides posadasii RMSCC 3488]